MRARVVAASAALHILAVIGVLVARTTVPRRTTVDIEIAPPRVTTEPAPPRRAEPAVAPTVTSGGNPVVAPAPHRGRPRAPRPPVDPPAPAVDPTGPAAPVAAPPPGDGDGAGLGGSGSGSGDGSGGDGGNADIDRSARPVPLNAGDMTLPYAEEAARRRIGGNVIVEVAVDPLGRVGRATVARGLGYGLDEIAVRSAMQLRFSPARDRAGRPIAATVRWRFHFDPP